MSGTTFITDPKKVRRKRREIRYTNILKAIPIIITRKIRDKKKMYIFVPRVILIITNENEKQRAYMIVVIKTKLTSRNYLTKINSLFPEYPTNLKKKNSNHG